MTLTTHIDHFMIGNADLVLAWLNANSSDSFAGTSCFDESTNKMSCTACDQSVVCQVICVDLVTVQ